MQLIDRPTSITVSFDYEFGTDEVLQSAPFNDAVNVTLLTGAGPFPIIVSDSWGTTINGGGMKRKGTADLGIPNPGCEVAHQSGRISVKYTRAIPVNFNFVVFNSPVQLQFSVSDHGDSTGVSFLCVDNIVVKYNK